MAVPRDLLVFVTPIGLGRVGPTLNDGPQVLVDSLCRTLGLGVDHLLIVNFRSFADLVDQVGGIDVTLPVPERDTVLDFRYSAGSFHFDGGTALTYVRARHLEEFRNGNWQPDPEAALGRGARARQVLAQIGRKAPSFSDPIGYTRFAWTATGAVSVDTSAGLTDLRSLFDALHKLGKAHEVQLPVQFRDGNVPVAMLRPRAASVLRTFEGFARRGPCARPQLPYSDGTIGRPRASSTRDTARSARVPTS
jgi:LCP family protein required for cell wall assembly